jgi:hypothetical protein
LTAPAMNGFRPKMDQRSRYARTFADVCRCCNIRIDKQFFKR